MSKNELTNSYSIRDKIIEIVNKYPKKFSQIIFSDKELSSWVEHNSVISNPTSKSETIYSALHQIDPICENGKSKKFRSIVSGYGFCAHNKTCECSNKNSSIKISNIKNNYSNETKEHINKKRESTLLAKTGYRFNSQRPEVKKILQKPKIPIEVHALLNNYEWLNDQYNIQQKTLVDIARELNIYYSTVADYCTRFNFKLRRRANYSLVEKDIGNFVKSLGFNVTLGDWDQLTNKEIDIFVPELNIGIEINGLYWHSFPNLELEDKTKHLNKSKMCTDKNIQLIHITDWQWYNKKPIVENLIRSKLKVTEKIGARKCSIVEISNKNAKVFFEKYHMQGYAPANKTFALVYNDNIVMAASFGKSRYSKKAEIELLRLSSTANITVIGGGSKLLKHAVNFFKTSIISYCDRDRGTGESYKSMGFELIGETGPGYFWTDGTNIVNRHKAQKNNLKKWLKSFDLSKSETENMFGAGYRRFWNCGNFVFLYGYKS